MRLAGVIVVGLSLLRIHSSDKTLGQALEPSVVETQQSNLTTVEAVSNAHPTKEEDIPVNPLSTLAGNIEWIRHDVQKARIIVQLQTNRTCHNPSLIGRLSGPSLTMIDWLPLDKEQHRLVGHYHAPISKPHFVEIIAEFCEALTFNAAFKGQCLEKIGRAHV